VSFDLPKFGVVRRLIPYQRPLEGKGAVKKVGNEERRRPFLPQVGNRLNGFDGLDARDHFPDGALNAVSERHLSHGATLAGSGQPDLHDAAWQNVH
jgi:hypothetical protein